MFTRFSLLISEIDTRDAEGRTDFVLIIVEPPKSNQRFCKSESTYANRIHQLLAQTRGGITHERRGNEYAVAPSSPLLREGKLGKN